MSQHCHPATFGIALATKRYSSIPWCSMARNDAKSPMTKSEIRRYQRRLLALKRRLGADLTALEAEALHATGGEASGGFSNVPTHPADLGTDAYEEEIDLSLLEKKD